LLSDIHSNHSVIRSDVPHRELEIQQDIVLIYRHVNSSAYYTKTILLLNSNTLTTPSHRPY